MAQRTFSGAHPAGQRGRGQPEAESPAGTPEMPQLAGNRAVLHMLGITRVQMVSRAGGSSTDAQEQEADQAAAAVAGSPAAAPSAAPAAPEQRPDSAPGTLLVEDDAASLAAGQMRKTEFLAQLRIEICAAADAGMAASGQNSQGCPWIDYWLNYYAAQPAEHVERALRRFAPETAVAQSARDFIPLVAARVRQGSERYAQTGETPDIPEGMAGAAAGPTLSFKARPGGAAAWDSPRAVVHQLGAGRPLDGDVRARMEPAFGTSFSHVRLHTDGGAGALSDRMNARAFAVGEHVAFAPGEYRPGSPEGDALIAHELAHVVQQGRAAGADSAAEAALERDASQAAAGAVLGRELLSAKPRLRSGLSLRRCSKQNLAPGPQLLQDFARDFSEAADLIRRNPEALRLVTEAAAAGVRYGGYSEDGPDHSAWAYTVGQTVYVPRARTDSVLAMNAFLFELNNAVRSPRFAQIHAAGQAGTIDAAEYARQTVEQEVEGMLRLGEIWFEMKRRHGGTDWDRYDDEFYQQEYNDFRAGRKTKDDLIRDVLHRVYTGGAHAGMTVEQYYMSQYREMHPAGAGGGAGGGGAAGVGAGGGAPAAGGGGGR